MGDMWEWVDFDAMSVTNAAESALVDTAGTQSDALSNGAFSGEGADHDIMAAFNYSPTISESKLGVGDPVESNQASSSRGETKSSGPKDAGKRREQNRAAQRAYRDRQKVLVEGLLGQVQDLNTKLQEQTAKCELLEMMCRRLKTENEVFREFLQNVAANRESFGNLPRGVGGGQSSSRTAR